MCAGGPSAGERKALDSHFLGCGSGTGTPQIFAVSCLSQMQDIIRRKENTFPETCFWLFLVEEVQVLRLLVCRCKLEALKTFRLLIHPPVFVKIWLFFTSVRLSGREKATDAGTHGCEDS